MAHLLGAAVILVATVTGCDAEERLTADRAKDMLTERLQADKRSVNVSYEAIVPLLDIATTRNYLTATDLGPAEQTVRALAEKGFVTQETSKVETLDVSGTYTGGISGCAQTTMTLEENEDAEVTGTFTTSAVPNCYGYLGGYVTNASVRGRVLPTGQLALLFEPPLEKKIADVNLNINGSADETILAASVPVRGWVNEIRFGKSGVKKGPELRQYTYRPSDAFLKLTAGVNEIQGGALGVAKLGHVLLVTETAAEAAFEWDASLNEISRIVAGTDRKTGSGSALFRKQADSTWVLAEYRVK